MKFGKKFARTAGALAVASVVVVAAVASAGPPPGKGKNKPPKDPPPPPPPTESPDPDPPAPDGANQADIEFVAMMIPHHFQATVMGDLATTRAGTDELQAFAERISVEQTVEIGMMNNWQTWNGLDVTDAESAYQMMLGNPMMLEMMGMASPAEMDQLSASSGTAFDRLYLELMITHHQGAIDMLVDVITNGSDFILQGWATEMLNAQTFQIAQMEEMLAEID